MCIRLEKFLCVFDLRLGVKVVAVWTLLISISMIAVGGWYLYEGSLDQVTDSSAKHGVYNFEKYRAFGGLYLSFGCIWILILMSFVGGIHTDRGYFLIPWLAFMLVTIGGSFAIMVSEAIIMNYNYLIVLPMILITFYCYSIVFSYYMELRDEKQDLRKSMFRY